MTTILKSDVNVSNQSDEDLSSSASKSQVPALDTGSNSIFSKVVGSIRSPWGQVWIISFVCFCLPGIYNALSGLGGSGQVDSSVAANGLVALLSVGAATGVFFAGPLISWIGPRLSLALGGWTYALYSGSLLNYNHKQNAAFIYGSAAILGLGANMIWIPEGTIMTSYVKDEDRGKAIAVFWMIFNLGGGIGALASLGLNFDNASSTVTDSTYVAFIVIMLFGWVLGAVCICNPAQLNAKYTGERISKVNRDHKEIFSFSKILDTAKFTFKTLSNWKFLSFVPMFFYANVFYSYQQNSVNGMTFNIRTRSLNSALYWIAQMVGGFLIGFVLDLKYFKRGQRVVVGWIILFVTGMVIWGGGLRFQLWNDERIAKGFFQDLDFSDREAVGPMFLYIFYGMYDALWQGYCYWLMGYISNSPAESGILVGTYKTFQCTGGAMSYRINALDVKLMSQLALNWGLTGGTLLIALPSALCLFREDKKGLSEKSDEIDKLETNIESSKE